MRTRPGISRSATATVMALAAAVALWALVGCGSGTDETATSTTDSTPQTKGPSSKIPATVAKVVDRLEAGESPGGGGPGFSDSGVPVRAGGELQLEYHAAGPVTDAQQAELTALGAEIVAADPATGIVDAWVPFGVVQETADLPWVASVTVPTPARAP